MSTDGADIVESKSPSRKALAQKTVAGLVSTGVSKVVLAAVSIAITTILARQLEPRDFGLVGMVTVFIAFLAMIGALGFDSAIIQKQQLSQRQLSTLFWIRIVVGCLSAGLLAAAASAISNFYNEPRLTRITQVLSCVFVTSSLYQTHRSTLRKELRFGTIAGITISSVVFSGIVGVAVAWLGGGVWSLVIQMLTLDLVSAVLHWRANSWRPTLVIAWKETLPVIRFGIVMATGSFVLYVQRNIDSLLIGRILGATPLGYYALAYRIMYSPVRQLSYIFTDVLFPSLSTIQKDTDAIRRAYTRSVKFIALVTFPVMTLVSLFSRELVQALFGAQWSPAAVVIGILAPAGALQSLTQLAYVVFPVVDRPRLALVQYLVGCLLLATGVIVGSRWGLAGAAWGVLASSISTWMLAQYLVAPLLAMRLRDVVGAFRNSLGCCMLIVLVRTLVGQTLGLGAESAWLLVATVFLCASAYGISIFLIEKQELLFLRNLVWAAIVRRHPSRQAPKTAPSQVGEVQVP